MPKNISFNMKKMFRFVLFALLITLIFVATLYLADFVTNNSDAQNIVSRFGYLGVLAIGVVTGLNIFIPVPAATFVPLFTAAGFWMPLVIVVMVIGTTIADMVGYIIGRLSKGFAENNYPETYSRLATLNEKHHSLVLPFLFIYAAIAPFPNEIVLIPLAIMGFKFRKLIIPVLFGNLIYQTILSLGVTNIFELVF